MIPQRQDAVQIQDLYDLLHTGTHPVNDECDFVLQELAVKFNEKADACCIRIRNMFHIENYPCYGSLFKGLPDGFAQGVTVCGDQGILHPHKEIGFFDIRFDLEFLKGVCPPVLMQDIRISFSLVSPAFSSNNRHSLFTSPL